MMLAIWRKDWKRLWWAVLISIGILGRLAYLDATRNQSMPSSEESWLSIVLPLAWVAILGMAVHEDAPGDSRDYWTSLPVRWRDVVCAKLLFALTAVQIPYLIASYLILQGRGLDWSAYPVDQAIGQLKVMAIVTLPGMAVAALLRNLSQVLLTFIAAVAIAGGLMVTEAGRPALDEVLIGLAVAWLGTAALGVLLLRYAKSGRIGTWGLAAIGFTGCLTLAVGLPQGSGIALRKAWAGNRIQASLRFEDVEIGAPSFAQIQDGRAKAALPLISEGIDTKLDQSFHIDFLKLTSEDGSVIEAENVRPNQPSVSMYAYLGVDGQGKTWQVLSFLPDTYKKWKGRRVTIKGRALLSLSRWVKKAEATAGSKIWVPQVGKCKSETVTLPWVREALRAACESGGPIPKMVQADVDDKWITYFPASSWLMSRQGAAWLSPIYRGEAYFHVNKQRISGVESDWTVPRDQSPRAKLVWKVAEPVGVALVDFEWREVDLDRYFVKP